jgi:hypothetical protein
MNGPIHISRGVRLRSQRRKGNYVIPDDITCILQDRRIDSTWKLSVDLPASVNYPSPNASVPVEFRVKYSPKMGESSMPC